MTTPRTLTTIITMTTLASLAGCAPAPGGSNPTAPTKSADGEPESGAVGPLGGKVDLRGKLDAKQPFPADDDPRIKIHDTSLRCPKDYATLKVHWTTFGDGNAARVLSVWAEITRIAPANKM